MEPLLLEPQKKAGVTAKGALLAILGAGVVSSPFWIKPDYYRTNKMSAFPQTHDCGHYSYEDPTEDWPSVTCRFGVENQCGETSSGTQSPIDIPISSCQESRCMDGSEGYVRIFLDMKYNDTFSDTPVCSVSDLTSKLVPDVTAKTFYNFNDTCLNPMIYVEDMPADKQFWELQQLHFHTGGSEHTIDGERFEGELHMVHKLQDGDDLLVIAVLLTSSTNYTNNGKTYYYENQDQDEEADADVDEDADENDQDEEEDAQRRTEENDQATTNAYMHMEPLLQYYESIASNIQDSCNNTDGISSSSRTKDADFVDSSYMNHQEVDVYSSSYYYNENKNGNAYGYYDDSNMNANWSPYKLLPSGAGVYAYEGSLTTPPCSTGVQWIVADTPLYVPEYQIQRLTNVISSMSTPSWPSCEMSSSDSELLDTFRPTQSRGGRAIQHDCSIVSS